MITGIGMYDPHGCYMSFSSLLLTGFPWERKSYIRLSGVLSFQGVHDAAVQWTVSTNFSATAAVKDWTGVDFDDCEVKYIGRDGPEEDD